MHASLITTSEVSSLGLYLSLLGKVLDYLLPEVVISNACMQCWKCSTNILRLHRVVACLRAISIIKSKSSIITVVKNYVTSPITVTNQS